VPRRRHPPSRRAEIAEGPPDRGGLREAVFGRLAARLLPPKRTFAGARADPRSAPPWDCRRTGTHSSAGVGGAKALAWAGAIVEGADPDPPSTAGASRLCT